MKVDVTVRTGDGGGHEIRISKGDKHTMRYVIPDGDKFIMVNPYADPRASVSGDTFEEGLKAAIDSVDF